MIKHKKKKADLSPEIKPKPVSKKKKINIKYSSNLFFFFTIHKANNRGNNLDKYDPRIS